MRLVEKFPAQPDSDGRRDASTELSAASVPTAESASAGEQVRVTVGGRTHVLDRERASELRDALDDALSDTREFVHTTGAFRATGEYVVERRGADSAGHRKVFPSFEHVRRLYDRLPDRFTAEDLTRSGLTGGRRHMVLWHFVEHPAFACSLASRQPLTVEKEGERG